MWDLLRRTMNTTYLPAIVGIAYRDEDAQERARQLEIGEKLTFLREPENMYDGNAIQVFTQDDSTFIGYIAAEPHARVIAPLLDRGLDPDISVYGFGDAQSTRWPYPTPILQVTFRGVYEEQEL